MKLNLIWFLFPPKLKAHCVFGYKINFSFFHNRDKKLRVSSTCAKVGANLCTGARPTISKQRCVRRVPLCISELPTRVKLKLLQRFLSFFIPCDRKQGRLLSMYVPRGRKHRGWQRAADESAIHCAKGKGGARRGTCSARSLYLLK